MKKRNLFENLINNDLYQVFLFASPAHIPLSIWTHPWFVINKKGKLFRYEVLHKSNRSRPECGHIHVDNLPLFDGIEVFLFLKHPRWNATLLGQIQGGENSAAQRMCDFIEHSICTYKNKDHYCLVGPNSNTYIQWVLDNSPEFTGRLKWNALGNEYGK
jgi:hypothetical protein